MRCLSEKDSVSKQETGYDTGRNYNPVSIPAANVLTLPRISPEIPLVYADSCNAKVLDLGKALIENGVPLENTEAKTILQIIWEGLDHFVNEAFHGIETPASFTFDVEDYSYNVNDIDNVMSFYVNANLDSVPCFVCKDKIEEMHRKGNGLIEFALCLLYKSPVSVMTPADFMYIVSCTEWMGFDDDTEYVEEMCADGTNREDIDVLTMEDVLKVVPKWAIDASYMDIIDSRSNVVEGTLTQKEIHLLHLLDELHAVCKRILLTESKYQINRGDHEYSAIMFMDDAETNGLYYHVIDQLYQSNMEGDQRYLFLFELQMVNPCKNTKEWMSIIMDMGIAWRLINQILPLIGESI